MSDIRVNNDSGGDAGGGGGGGFWGFLNNTVGLLVPVLGSYFGRNRDQSQQEVVVKSGALGLDPGLTKILILAAIGLLFFTLFRVATK